MKSGRSFGAAAAVFCFLLCISSAYPQDRRQNRPPVATPPFSPHPSAEDQLLLDATNRERSAAGLQPLEWDEALATAARQHAQVMASQNLLLHQCLDEPPLEQRAAKAGARFSMIAENIAVGPNPETIYSGWMHSPGHRKNILNAEVSAVGIATMRGSGGLFAVQDFSRPVEALSLEQQEEKVVSLLRGNGLLAAEVTADARKTCNLDHGFAGAPASYAIRFEVTDLSKLPDNLLQKVKSRAYRRAAVGACRGGGTAGFTLYHIAVLLN
jgi:cysteine-rich secretory family protein